jgi:hypothetical protein
MSADKSLTLLACGLCLATATVAGEEPPPEADAEFIEYLGMWEETDEDWMLLEEIQVAESDERSDPVPEGEESTEKTDES